jgi:polyisoprenoid-binding protein YceI
MIRRIAMIAALACAVLAPASAAQWNVDFAKSRLGFTVSWSGQPFEATFKSWKADINFDSAVLAHAKATVTIDLGSETSSAPDNDDGLKGAEGFAISQFPTARFETTGFTSKSGGNYVANGRLSLHGVTKQISLPFHLTIVGNSAHMTAKAVVLRTDFGLGQGEWASPAIIAHEVAIIVDLTATKTR